jgi:hypothetical protein
MTGHQAVVVVFGGLVGAVVGHFVWVYSEYKRNKRLLKHLEQQRMWSKLKDRQIEMYGDGY